MSSELGPVDAGNGTSLVHAVYDSILKAIIAGRLTPGTVLSEVSLARQMQVSRTPVHDALRQLAKEGIIQQSAGRRARVASFTRDDVFEVFELCKYLEGPAAELAAGRMDQRQLRPLRALADELNADSKALQWASRWTDFDDTFHRAIADASGNRRLAEDISRYRLLHRGFNRIAAEAERLQRALREQVAILDALEARDGPTAREQMTAHLSNWQAYFVEHFPQGRM